MVFVLICSFQTILYVLFLQKYVFDNFRDASAVIYGGCRDFPVDLEPSQSPIANNFTKITRAPSEDNTTLPNKDISKITL